MPQQFSDHNTDKAFREKLSGLRVEPRSRVWYRVSAGLDREAALLSHKKRRVMGVFIGLFILTGAILTAVLDPVATRKKVLNSEGQIHEIKSLIKEHSAKLSGFISNENNTVKSSGFILQQSNGGSFNSDYIEFINLNSTNKNTELNEINYLFSYNNLIIQRNLNSIITYQKPEFILSDEPIGGVGINPVQSCNCESRFYLGVNTAFNNTTIKDQTLKENLNYNHKFHFGNSTGLFVGFKIFRNFSTEIGWNIFANEGAKYTNKTLSRKPDAIPVINEYTIALRYTQIPVLVRYGVETWSGLLNKPVTYSIAAGIIYGRLNKVSYSVADFTIDSKFKTSELAGVGNIAVDIRMNKHISVFTGVQASYSNLIFVEAKRVSPFSYPHNFATGIQAGFKYNFCRK